jgi:hypothetical protein
MDDPTLLPAHASDAQAGVRGLLGVWHGVEPGSEEAFDDWYDRQHHRERVGVPGFLRARRYLNAAQGPRYFNRYDVTGVQVLASPAYLDRLNHPTEWTRAMLPRYRDTTRGVFRLVSRLGDADGGSLVTLRIPDGALQGTDVWLERCRVALQTLTSAPGVLGAECWLADAGTTTLRSEEKRLRPDVDAMVAQVLLVEGSDLDRVDRAVALHLRPLIHEGALADRFRLVYDLRGRPEPRGQQRKDEVPCGS